MHIILSSVISFSLQACYAVCLGIVVSCGNILVLHGNNATIILQHKYILNSSVLMVL